MKFLLAVSLIAVASLSVFGVGANRLTPSPRIVNGKDIANNAYPFQVSVQRIGYNHICGGAIISPNYVVTAAHCTVQEYYYSRWVNIPASQFSVRVGSDYHASGGHVEYINEIIRHPGYYGSDTPNDIALLRLAAPLVLSASVKAIAVATTPPPPGSEVTIVGWGRTKYLGSSPPRMLETTLFAMPNKECRAYTRKDTDGILCLARKSITGICNGDSGGAAIYENTLVGLTSYQHDESCSTMNPDMFANVANYNDWLRKNSDL